MDFLLELDPCMRVCIGSLSEITMHTDGVSESQLNQFGVDLGLRPYSGSICETLRDDAKPFGLTVAVPNDYE